MFHFVAQTWAMTIKTSLSYSIRHNNHGGSKAGFVACKYGIDYVSTFTPISNTATTLTELAGEVNNVSLKSSVSVQNQGL